MSTTTLTARARAALPLRNVQIEDAFWAPRRQIVRDRTIPQQEHQLRTGGQLDALRLDWRPGQPEPHIFWESDIGKWIEAASYSLIHHPDLTLEGSVDEAVELLANAQQPDGYLNVYFTVVKPGQRFTDLRDAHELYCLGHLIEGAVAYFQATGKRRFLDLVIRYADLVEREFSAGGIAEGGYDGHQEIELALIKLAHVTGQRRYLELAARMIDDRGRQPFYFETERERRGDDGYFQWVFPRREQEQRRYREYNQSHLPVREQRDAVGHSVRAMYMYSAMADLAMDLDDHSLLEACERLWQSVTQRKMYVTGGIGSEHSIEGFGNDYELSNETNYNETCASIGLVLWAHRMNLATGKANYIDVLENALYNTVLAGASADGTHYFYGNPMQSDGQFERSEWFGVACCPPNFARLVTSLEQYAYAADHDTAIVNLFIEGSATFPLADHDVTLAISTRYPWEGRVELRVQDPGYYGIAVRIPGWSTNVQALLNGVPLPAELSDGYLVVRRDWDAGDTLSIDVPIHARRIWANDQVSAAAGRVAIARGPLLYCAESPDNQARVAAITLPRDTQLQPTQMESLDVLALAGSALSDSGGPSEDHRLYRDDAPPVQATELQAIPYFAWGNRGRSSMRVWLQDQKTR